MVDYNASIAEKQAELQAVSRAYQAAAAQDVNAARLASQRVSQVQADIQRLKAQQASEQAGRDAITAKVYSDDVAPIQYTQRKADGKKTIGTYDPVVVKKITGGYVKEYYRAFTKDTNTGYRSNPLVTKEVYYDAQGNETKVITYDRDSEGKLTRKKKEYLTKGVTETSDKRAQEATGQEVYTASDAAGKTWVSTNPSFIKEKTGVDVTMIRPDTTILREEGSGNVYYGKYQEVRGKTQLLAVGQKNAVPERSTVVAASKSPFVAPKSTTPIEEYQAARTSGIKAIITAKQPTTDKTGELGSNITTQPAGTKEQTPWDTLTKGGQFSKTKGIVTQSSPEWDLAERRIPSSSVYAEKSFQADIQGRGMTAAAYDLGAVGLGFVEAAKGTAAMVRNPLLVAEMFKPSNLKATTEEVSKNPFGTAGQVAFFGALGKTTGVLASRGARLAGKSAATEALIQAETSGKGVFYPESGVGEVSKGTVAKVKVGGNVYDIAIKTPSETFGKGQGSLVSESAADTARKIRSEGITKEYGVSEGDFSFEISKNGKQVAIGEGATSGASVDAGIGDFYLREAETSAFINGKEYLYGTQESGLLKEQFRAETPLKPQEGSAYFSITEGRGGVLQKGARPTNKQTLIKEQGKTTTTTAPSYLYDLSSGYKTKVGFEPSTSFEITGGEARQATKFDFTTQEQSVTLQPTAKPQGLTAFESLQRQYDSFFKLSEAERVKVGGSGEVTNFETLFEPTGKASPKRPSGIITAKGEPFFEPTAPSKPVTVQLKEMSNAPKGSQPTESSGLVTVKKTTTTQFTKLSGAEKVAVSEVIGELEAQGVAKPRYTFVPVTQESGLLPVTQQPGTVSLPAYNVGQFNKQSPQTNTIYDTKQNSEGKITPKYSLVNASALKGASLFDNKITQVGKTSQELKTDVALTQKITPFNKLTQKTFITTRGGTPPITPPETPPPTTPFFFNKPREEKKAGGLFTVEVKRRGRFEKLQSFSDMKSAFTAGARNVDTTSAATFRVRTKEGFAKLPSSLGGRFTRSKSVFGGIVEKSKYRISTAGEKGDISPKKKGFLGLGKSVFG